MKRRYPITAVHATSGLVTIAGATTVMHDVRAFRCLETGGRYLVDGYGMIPADAYASGLRMLGIRREDGVFDLAEGMTLEEVD